MKSKRKNYREVASPFEFADEAVIKAKIGAGVGSLGPVNLNIPVIIDRSVALVSDFSAGATLMVNITSISTGNVM